MNNLIILFILPELIFIFMLGFIIMTVAENKRNLEK